jgi:hypothetical protein
LLSGFQIHSTNLCKRQANSQPLFLSSLTNPMDRLAQDNLGTFRLNIADSFDN